MPIEPVYKRGCVVLCAALAIFALPIVARGSTPEAPGAVVLVTFDTLRADRLAPETMPVLTGLAAQGWSFTRTHTPVPLTLPAHATIMTGLGPAAHGVRDNIGYALDPGLETVAERFKAEGFATAAFVGGYPLSRSFGLARGFDVYDDRMTRASAAGPAGNSERRADEVVAAATAWLADRAGARYFLWVHLFDPHDPYEAPAGPWTGHAHPYDDEVAFADRALGELLAAIERKGGEAPWIVVTADHGEGLGEHGEATHGVFLYEETLHVPLVVARPGTDGGAVVETAVSLADLAPTLLELAGLPPLERTDGVSLVPGLAGDGFPPQRATYVESIHGRRKYGWAPLAGYLDWPQKFIAAPRPELYDLSRDPEERYNLAEPTSVAGHRQRLSSIRGSIATSGAAAPSTADLERLRSLGYVGGGAGSATEEQLQDRQRPDPKDRIDSLEPLTAGLEALAAGRLAEARKRLRQALELDPDNLVALNNLGIVQMQRGKRRAAEETFARGLALDPLAENLANNLGLARSRLGRHRQAVEAFRTALSRRPGFTAARFNLALALHRSGRHEEALQELERVGAEEPGFPQLEPTIEQIRRVLEADPDEDRRR
jgi:arylsulfatase A-like enzyme